MVRTIEVDEFTRNLFELYETVRNEGFTQVCQVLTFIININIDYIYVMYNQ